MDSWTVVGDADGDPTGKTCAHVSSAGELPAERPDACVDCLREGSRWLHLRQCLACGHVGCCDQSPRRHATAHHRHSAHPLVRSAQPGEDWAWCYPDELFLLPADRA